MKQPTKKARIELAREIIDRNVLDVPFSAEYQILCRSCNASKGITKSVRKTYA